MVTEQRGTLEAGRRGHVVIRVSSLRPCRVRIMMINIRYCTVVARITIVRFLTRVRSGVAGNAGETDASTDRREFRYRPDLCGRFSLNAPDFH